MIYCLLKNKIMPWGDYGSILLSGMACHRGMILGRLQIERTGPFIPPIIDAGIWRFIVSSRLKERIQNDHPDVRLIRSIKRKISKVEWEKWDINADKPLFYPDEGEPENYILSKWHNIKTSMQMGPIYQFSGRECFFVGKGVNEITGLSESTGKVALVNDGCGHRNIFRIDFAQWLESQSDGSVQICDKYQWTI